MRKYAEIMFCLFLLFSCHSKTHKDIVTKKKTDTIQPKVDSYKIVSDNTSTQNLLSQIVGIYKTENNNEKYELGYCDMKIVIRQKKNKCFYSLETKGSNYLGEAIYKVDTRNEILITLKGIKWEAEGNVDTTSNSIKFEEISGVLSGKELTFQNDGNAMNYYVKFSECGQKYIQLIKQ